MTPALATALVQSAAAGPGLLTVLYDERCPLCRRLKAWLGHQATLVPIEFVAAGSSEARRRYPTLDHERTLTVLTVVLASGAVYEGERGWLACAWVLPQLRQAAEHFSGRLHLPLVRVVARTVDWYREKLINESCEAGCRVSS